MVLCCRCNKTVYFNEEKKAINKSFHVSCFVCANNSCKRRLDTGSLTEHEGEIYCKQCYGKLFGPKGYGYGTGAGTLSMHSESSLSNVPATAQAYVAPKSAPVVETNGQPKFGSRDVCPRCNKVVYMAELVRGAGFAWHKTTCFNCKECKKHLESANLCERESEIYCKTCYGKLYGPKYYGHGVITAPIEGQL